MPDLTGTTAAEVSPRGGDSHQLHPLQSLLSLSVAMSGGQAFPSLAVGGAFVIARLRWIAVSACDSLRTLVVVGGVTGARLSSPFVLAHPNGRLVVELVP